MAEELVLKDWDNEAGRLCLDFANTVDWHGSEHPEDGLTGYPDLVSWAGSEGLLAEPAVRALLKAASQRPAAAQAALRKGVALRESIFRIFSAQAHGRRPADADLQVLNAHLAEAMGRSKVIVSGNRFTWGWDPAPGEFEQVLWPVARSAAELLASPEVARVGECADDRGCGWLFFDTSRNHSRRWCSMDSCGNRAKAKRHVQRERARPGAAAGA